MKTVTITSADGSDRIRLGDRMFTVGVAESNVSEAMVKQLEDLTNVELQTEESSAAKKSDPSESSARRRK